MVEKRTKNIQVRVTDDEKKAIEAKANEAGLSMASFVRTTLLNNVRTVMPTNGN